MSLVIENLCKTYKATLRKTDRTNALNNVSFSLGEGKILALIGQNGAGKSTLIKCLLGLIFPESGKIDFGGEKIKELVARNELGYMPEAMRFPSAVTLQEYIESMLELRGNKLADYTERYDELTKKLFLTPHLGKRIKNFSKGTAKKAVFVQAVLHSPRLLVLDEPTDGLDPVSRRVLLDELLKMNKRGSTVIITTHLLSDIGLVADEIVVLKNGSLIKQEQMANIGGSLDDWYLELIKQNGGLENL